MSSESGTKHGLNPTFVVFDELAQAKNRDLYDVLDTSFGARAEPLLTSLNTSAYLVFTGVELISIYRALAMRDHHGRNV
jgi:phage terminase large subunit-like protein